MSYRLSQEQKENISGNLVAFMESKEDLSQDSADFIIMWIKTGSEEKTKAFYDVWDIVLKNYIPQTRPVLFRSCTRIIDDKIVSFTGSIYCAHRFSKGKGLLLICDTNDVLLSVSYGNGLKRGEYQNTFFPIAELLKKEAKSAKPKFHERTISEFSKEDEYIMRVNLCGMYPCKWHNNRMWSLLKKSAL